MRIRAKNSGRIDKLLAEELKSENISRSYVQKLIIDGNVTVNDKKVSRSYSLKEEDIIEIIIPDKVELNVKAKDIKFEIVYQDKDIVVVNKPNDLVVHPSAGHLEDTLVNGLINVIDNLSDINGIIRPGIVHRIDKMTTGLLVVAKTNNAHKFLSEKIKNKEINRYYYALVHGTFVSKTATIDAPIGRDMKNRKKMTVTGKNSKDAKTFITVIKTFKKASLIECELYTGRTHQIRVHLKYIGHPVIGDNEYGISAERNCKYGQYLHAYKLKLTHPVTKKQMIFTTDLPKEFKVKIKEYELQGEIKK